MQRVEQSEVALNLHWPRLKLPFFILLTVALVAAGGFFAVSNLKQVVTLTEVINDHTNFLVDLDDLTPTLTQADRSLHSFIKTNSEIPSQSYKGHWGRIWGHIGRMWHTDGENNEAMLYDLQCKVHDLERFSDGLFLKRQLDRPITRADHRKYSALTTMVRDRIVVFKSRINGDITEYQGQLARTLQYLRAAIFMTPTLTILMLLIAFSHISRWERKRRQLAESLNDAKSRFLANMSHEIRTPLCAVLGFAEVLGQKATPAAMRAECVAALKRNGQLLLKIIDDILDISKIEAQKLEIQSVDFDLRELVKDLQMTLEARAQSKGVAFSVRVEPSANGIFKSDPSRLKQILLNIVGNAIKFTRAGVVELAVEVIKGDTLRAEVRDTGIGISDTQSRRLFQPFTQADSSTERYFGGTGLGLSISRQLARAMGGDVRLLRSQVGSGSCFEITAHLEPKAVVVSSRLDDTQAGEISRWKNKRILVVDDCEDNRHLVELYLQATGIQVMAAASGEEALRVVRAHIPDLILMDIQMPVKNGYDTTREIRDLGVREPIIAFTAHAMHEDLDRCRKSGCNTVLTKPVFREDLFSVLTRYLG